MINPLANFKNPYDIDGEIAKKILNQDQILGDTSKFLDIPSGEDEEGNISINGQFRGLIIYKTENNMNFVNNVFAQLQLLTNDPLSILPLYEGKKQLPLYQIDILSNPQDQNQIYPEIDRPFGTQLLRDVIGFVDFGKTFPKQQIVIRKANKPKSMKDVIRKVDENDIPILENGKEVLDVQANVRETIFNGKMNITDTTTPKKAEKGEPVDAVIYYDYTYPMGGLNATGISTRKRPPRIGLAHELIHAYYYTTGKAFSAFNSQYSEYKDPDDAGQKADANERMVRIQENKIRAEQSPLEEILNNSKIPQRVIPYEKA